ncbi:MAG: hypothetical protein AB1744_01550, partial [Candidatus Zixiibacteriota bacterium]
KQYVWSAPTSPVLNADSETNGFPIVIKPALSDGTPVTCNAPELNWSGPGISSEDNYAVTPFFRDSSQVSLAVNLVYDTGDSFPVLTKTSLVKAWPLESLVQSGVDPASFTVPFSGEKLLRYYISPAGSHQQLDEVLLLNKAFSASISSIEWRKSGNHIGDGNPHSYNQSNGTGTIEAFAKILVAEQDFQPPAPSAEGTLSAVSHATDRPLTGIKIRLQGDNQNLEKFVSGYRKVTTYFQAIGFSGREEIGPVSVNWSLSGGDVPADSMRSNILALYNVQSNKVGAINGSYSKLLESPVASFTSFFTTNGLPGPLTLVASNGEAEASITISIKQPTVYVSIKGVVGIEDYHEPLNLWLSNAQETWGIENILKIKSRGPLSLIDNQPFNVQDNFASSSEYLLSNYFPEVNLLNPLVFDDKANYVVDNTCNTWVVPRQSEHLLASANRSIAPTDVNVYLTDYVLAKQAQNPLPELVPGYTIYKAKYCNRQTLQRISDYKDSGILISLRKNLHSPRDNSPLNLSHELGHILLNYGNEHDGIPGFGGLPSDNLMLSAPVANKLLPQQLCIVLDYENKKSEFFVVEEIYEN